MVQALTVSVMSRFKTPVRKLKVLRTLQLPCHFQLVLGRTRVAKVDATRGFAVVHRLYPGFRFAVRCVAHTKRAFVKYLLARFKKFDADRRAEAVRQLAAKVPTFDAFAPRCFPSVSDVVAFFGLLYFLAAYPFCAAKRKAQVREARDRDLQRKLALLPQTTFPKVVGATRMCPRCGTGFTKHGTRL